jgi:hypothetical protein
VLLAKDPDVRADDSSLVGRDGIDTAEHAGPGQKDDATARPRRRARDMPARRRGSRPGQQIARAMRVRNVPPARGSSCPLNPA